MKKIFLFIYIISASFLYSCSKEIKGRTVDVHALTPSKSDIDAGVWKTILLTNPAEFTIPAPIATTTPDYIAQVNEIKTWQQDLTS